MSLPAAAVRLLERIDPSAMRLGLEAPRRLLGELGDPQLRYSTVLVAGTNGKGSTAALLAAMATAAGYRTGLYTSPHLESLEERARVDGRPVAGAALGARLLEAGEAAERLGEQPTYFELVTAAALASFAAAGVELAVLEVGMGGRLDATNVAEPAISVITEIGLDHERHLGSSIREIAAEKAAILRRGRPAIAGCTRREALAAVRAAAAEIGARLVVAGERASWRRDPASGGVELATGAASYELRPALAGEHQLANLALAVLAAEELGLGGWPRLDAVAIRAGAARCRWPGRLERVALPGRELLLDVAHNRDAAAGLAAHLERLGLPYDLLFGILSDKPGALMLPRLAAGARRIVLSRPAGGRGLDPAALAPLVPARREAIVEPRREAALELLLSGSAPLAVVCGSFYLVGEVRALVTRRFGVPRPAVELASC